jgi:hypothetical protein
MRRPLGRREPTLGPACLAVRDDAAAVRDSAAGPAAPPQPAGGYADVGGVSVGELVGNLTRDLSTLMRQELALAQAKLKAEASKTGTAAGALGAAGVAGFLAALSL